MNKKLKSLLRTIKKIRKPQNNLFWLCNSGHAPDLAASMAWMNDARKPSRPERDMLLMLRRANRRFRRRKIQSERKK